MKKLLAVATLMASAAMAQSTPAPQSATPQSMPAQSASKPAAGSTVEPSKLYERGVSSIEKEFVSLAEAMPADKYDFAPTQGEFKGVRTFADQVRHVAQANMMFYGAVIGEKPSMDEMKASQSVKGKDQLVAMLKKSFEVGHRAAASITPENAWTTVESPMGPMSRAGLMTTGIAHAFDHYGQLVVYGRMNGIVPPATAEAQQKK